MALFIVAQSNVVRHRGLPPCFARVQIMGFHDLTMSSITGEPVEFAGFDDQFCLVVNVASR